MTIEADVFSYGGCSSCGNSLWNFLRQNGIKVKHVNVQITYERNKAIARARELGETGQLHFPMIFIGGKVVIGFKPNELMDIINEIKEAANE